ncbi:hypothetical protein [Xanthobacter versatilis]|uniref:hypothetical protein n=1 Tax=Xanthobacter autotrophicus (strain ATCC BAA-1158 / Py2) TaxID=78245 RepID=UPI0037285655
MAGIYWEWCIWRMLGVRAKSMRLKSMSAKSLRAKSMPDKSMIGCVTTGADRRGFAKAKGSHATSQRQDRGRVSPGPGVQLQIALA